MVYTMGMLWSAIRKIVFMLLALLLLVAVAGWLTLRYYVTPRLAQWQPQLQALAHRYIHPSLSFDQAQLTWKGAFPQWHLYRVRLEAPSSTPAMAPTVHHGPPTLQARPQAPLSIAHIAFSFNWLGWWQQPISQLRVERPFLMLKRDDKGHIYLGGHRLPTLGAHWLEEAPVPQHSAKAQWWPSAHAQGVETALLAQDPIHTVAAWLTRWLVHAPLRTEVVDGTLQWQDDWGHVKPALHVRDVHLRLTHDSQQLLGDFSTNALGGVRSRLQLNHAGNGWLDLRWERASATRLRPWFPIPAWVKQANLRNVQLRLPLQGLSPQAFVFSSELPELHLAHHDPNVLTVKTQNARLQIASTASGLQAPYQFQFSSEQIGIHTPNTFRRRITLPVVQASGEFRWTAERQPLIYADKVQVDLPEGQLQAQGSWQGLVDNPMGALNIQGKVHAFPLGELHRYMPKVIPSEVLDWLEKGFKQGYADNTSFSLRGPVNRIPYGLAPHLGDFVVQGELRDVHLHYHQLQDKKAVHWPDVIIDKARWRLHRGDIFVVAETARPATVHLPNVQASSLSAQILNLEADTRLAFDMNISADGAAVQRFNRITPLRELIDGALDHSDMQGIIKGNVHLSVPILQPHKTLLESQWQVQQGAFRFAPAFPWLKQLHGEMRITADRLWLQSMQGQALGGAFNLTGNIGGAGSRLQANGVVSATGLQQYLGLPILKRLKGQTPYQLRLDFLDKGGIQLKVDSQLQGISAELPDGVRKSRHSSVPFSLHLRRDAQRETWQFRYAKLAQLRIEKQRKRQRALLEVGQLGAPMPAFQQTQLRFHGLKGALMHWLPLIDELQPSGTSTGEAFMPPVRSIVGEQLHVQLFGLNIPQLSLQGKAKNDQDWQFQLQAPSLKAQLQLALSSDGLKGLQFHAEHLTLGRQHWVGASDNERNAPPTRLTLPTLQGQIDRLVWEDQLLGSLRIKGQPEGNAWQLQTFSLHNAVSSAFATGYVHHQGQQSDADIQLNINARNVGELLNYFQLPNQLNAGTGYANLRLRLPNLSQPSLSALRVDGQLQMKSGALLFVQNRAMKVLALISLQSLSRLKNMGSNTPSALGQGLAFDFLQSDFQFSDNVLTLKELRLDGPLVAMIGKGKTHMRNETLDAHIIAIPKLEMSGAALVTGFIVNPVVGVGAFLSQWFLSAAINRALTTTLHITGTWDAVSIQNDKLPDDVSLQDRQKQQEINALYQQVP